MSEPEVTTAESKSRHAIRHDWVFEDLVRLANSIDGFSMGVTVIVAGATITGDLVGIKDYFSDYGDIWQKALGETDGSTAVRDKWVEVGESQVRDIKEKHQQEFDFFHLRDARILSCDKLIPTSAGMLWRGRISQVSAFAIGVLSTQQKK